MLFDPLTLRGVTLRNRIAVSPMCQYSACEGCASDWHLVHLGSRAIGGAGLVMVEATAVEPRGRITPADLGIWDDRHIPALARIATFLKEHGAAPAIQLAHAGRKASTARPWEGGAQLSLGDGWTAVAPSAVPFNATERAPEALAAADVAALVDAFAAAARRSLAAGFEIAEIHGAHGYLIHQFLSPLSNLRTDQYGGSFENRIRFALEVTRAVRAVWPDSLPLFFRVSAQDWAPGGWTLEESVELARRLKALGVDLIDTSSGGLVPHAKIALGPGYQVRFASAIRHGAEVMTGAVGMITEPAQADAILSSDAADMILLARQLLRDPYWPLHAARALGVEFPAPLQYRRAFA